MTSKISTFVLHRIRNSIWVWDNIRTSQYFNQSIALNKLEDLPKYHLMLIREMA